MVWRHRLFASAAAAAILSTGTGFAPPWPAQGAPDDPPGATGCQLELSSPYLAILPDGGKAIAATLNPASCAPTAQPTDVKVCISPPNRPGSCKRTPGWSTAQVLAAPASGTFSATGQICWLEITRSFQPECRSGGPLSATF